MCVDWSARDEVPYLSSALGVADISLELLSLTDTFCGEYPALGTPQFRPNFKPGVLKSRSAESSRTTDTMLNIQKTIFCKSISAFNTE